METQQAYGTDVHELLLTALGMALHEWTGSEQILISTEGHGRQGHIPDIDMSRTAGWFTSVYPVLLDMRVPGGSGEKDRSPHKDGKRHDATGSSSRNRLRVS
nr:condensation domain-containing protein [Bacillus velezensis]